MNELRYKCQAKASDRENGSPRRGAAWVKSRRGWFKVFDDRVEFGDWIIPAAAVQEAVLFEMRQLFIPVFVLQLTAAEATYQFGCNPWSRVVRFQPFAVERRRAKLGYSAFSIVIRVVIAVAVIYWLWQQFG